MRLALVSSLDTADYMPTPHVFAMVPCSVCGAVGMAGYMQLVEDVLLHLAHYVCPEHEGARARLAMVYHRCVFALRWSAGF